MYCSGSNMSAAAWIVENHVALMYVLLGVLVLCAKIPFVQHNPIIEAIVLSAAKQVQGQAEQKPVVVVSAPPPPLPVPPAGQAAPPPTPPPAS